MMAMGVAVVLTRASIAMTKVTTMVIVIQQKEKYDVKSI